MMTLLAGHFAELTDQRAFTIFLVVTIVLGGGAAVLTGRAIAATWRPWWQMIAYVTLIAVGVRFLSYTVFGGALLSATAYAMDLAVAMAFAILGFRATRRAQMRRCYFWLAENQRNELPPPTIPGDN